MLLLLQPLFLLSGVARRTVIVMCKGRVRSAAALEDSTRHVSFSEGAELSIRLQLTLHAVAARGERRLANLIRQLLLLLEPAILLRLYCYTIRLSLVVCTSLLELRIELSRFVIPVVLASLVPTLQRMACGHEAQRTRRRACAQAAAAAWRRRTFLPMSTRPIRLRLFFFGLTTTSRTHVLVRMRTKLAHRTFYLASGFLSIYIHADARLAKTGFLFGHLFFNTTNVFCAKNGWDMLVYAPGWSLASQF